MRSAAAPAARASGWPASTARGHDLGPRGDQALQPRVRFGFGHAEGAGAEDLHAVDVVTVDHVGIDQGQLAHAGRAEEASEAGADATDSEQRGFGGAESIVNGIAAERTDASAPATVGRDRAVAWSGFVTGTPAFVAAAGDADVADPSDVIAFDPRTTATAAIVVERKVDAGAKHPQARGAGPVFVRDAAQARRQSQDADFGSRSNGLGRSPVGPGSSSSSSSPSRRMPGAISKTPDEVWSSWS